MAEVWSQSSSGASVLIHVSYTHSQDRGPLASGHDKTRNYDRSLCSQALAVTAGISLLSVTAMLLAILVSAQLDPFIVIV